MPNPARRAVALAVLAAAIVAATVALDLAPAAAQSDEQTGRIVARRLDDGRTEFGWQPAGAARVLPTQRYFPADARVDRWLRSSPVEVNGAEISRINARLRDDGRIEFGFTPTDGERIEPRARYFPVDARVGRWLRSTEIAIGLRYVAISAGGHACAIRDTGAIECWGWNDAGQQTDAPTGSFTAVSVGSWHTCAIHAESGAIECWGHNEYGAVGATDAPDGSFSAVSTGGIRSHTCAIRESGAIECWGENYHGQADPPAGSFTAVAAGVFHTCGLRESGAIECWGSNTNWQVSASPAGSFTAVSAGPGHTCAIRESGEIWCWGNNQLGQTDAPAGSFTAVSAGAGHSCAIRESGAIECWGNNDGGRTDAPAGSFTAVSVGGRTCAIRESGEIECWPDP